MPTPPNAPHEWTTTGLLDEVVENNKNMQDRSLAFILGAGASVTSGIPAGGKLAQRWLKEIYDRENMHPDTTLETWAAGKLGAPDFQLADAATQYAKIFSLRFGRDPQSGYAALQAAMEEAEPSIGYAILARLLATTRHKVVVTTNFDNLVADALAIHALQSPLVVGHEALTGFVRPRLSRPLVAKIHRDLHLDPINDQDGVDTLPKGWSTALKSLFQHYTPMVIGYGGNDGSLMGLLEELEPGFIPGGILWCYREGDRLNPRVLDVVARHSGVLVAIAGFDEFMVQLIEKLEPNFLLENIATEIEKLGQDRAEKYRKQAEKLGASTASNTERKTPASNQVRQSVLDVTKGKTSWWTWELLARGETDPEQKKKLYEEGLAAFPNSADLAGCYAIFLAEQHDYDAAGAIFSKALELDPNNANNTGNYALFLADQRQDCDAADAMYRKALDLDPNDADHTGNYALFLADQRQDYDAADAMFRKALELDPSHADHTGNYALFLANKRQDYDAADAMFRKALDLDPSNVRNTGNYALFLANKRQDYDAADAMYRQALELDPSNARNTGNYALFLANKRQDYDAADAMFRKALELDPSNANNTGNYALFLADQRQDYDAADAMYRKAIELDPNNANNTGNYANFLANKRQDYDAADAMYRKALELDPNNARNTGNYAVFLADQRHDYDAADAMYRKVIELDPNDFNSLANWACLRIVHTKAQDLPEVQQLIQQVIALSKGQVSQTLAEVLLYDVLLAATRLSGASCSQSISRLKGALTRGFVRGSWDFSAVFEATFPRIAAEDHDFYRALGSAILDESKVGLLAQYPQWRDAPEGDPFALDAGAGECPANTNTQ